MDKLSLDHTYQILDTIRELRLTAGKLEDFLAEEGADESGFNPKEEEELTVSITLSYSDAEVISGYVAELLDETEGSLPDYAREALDKLMYQLTEVGC